MTFDDFLAMFLNSRSPFSLSETFSGIRPRISPTHQLETEQLSKTFQMKIIDPPTMSVIPSAPSEHQLDEEGITTGSGSDPTSGVTSSSASSIVEDPTPDVDENFLVCSAYDEKPHLLDLRTLDIPNQLLAKSLVGLKCLREDYAIAPYVEIFNWAEVVDSVRHLAKASEFQWKESSFYIVVFRSRIPPTTVYEDLHTLDKDAHAEATKSGGFLKYWFGTPDKEGRNLATCVWRNQHDARLGSVGEAHQKAAGATRRLYTEWRIERLKLTIKDDVSAWEIVQWT